MTVSLSGPTPDAVVRSTRNWIERAVIGLNLCPFAKAAYSTDRVRFAVSDATTAEALRDDIIAELHFLDSASSAVVETTLLIHPGVLTSFTDYNAFLDTAGAALQSLDLVGVIQVASFHPAYQFANTVAEDVTNCTNRSPYPMLHLLREASVQAAVAAFPDTATIYQRNLETMRHLGAAGWAALAVQAPSTTITFPGAASVDA